MEWYLGVLQKYAVFDGRARRKEYCNSSGGCGGVRVARARSPQK
jgi:hypothetical protein